MSAALFALITLRNAVPGDPPFGSWMDIAVYFWVIAALMVTTVVTVWILVSRSSAEYTFDRRPAASDVPGLPPATLARASDGDRAPRKWSWRSIGGDRQASPTRNGLKSETAAGRGLIVVPTAISVATLGSSRAPQF